MRYPGKKIQSGKMLRSATVVEWTGSVAAGLGSRLAVVGSREWSGPNSAELAQFGVWALSTVNWPCTSLRLLVVLPAHLR